MFFWSIIILQREKTNLEKEINDCVIWIHQIELFFANYVLNTDILNCRTRSNHLACERPNAWTIKNDTSNKKHKKHLLGFSTVWFASYIGNKNENNVCIHVELNCNVSFSFHALCCLITNDTPVDFPLYSWQLSKTNTKNPIHHLCYGSNQNKSFQTFLKSMT